MVNRRLAVGVAATALLLGACSTANPTLTDEPESAPSTVETPKTTEGADDTAATTTTTTTVVSTTTVSVDPGAVESDSRSVDVFMDEFSFSPAEIDVSAGETITFTVTNSGAIVHEFRLSNPHRIEEHMADGHNDHNDVSHHEDGDVYIELDPGETGQITVTFSDDVTFFTEAACLIPGHYEAGMTVPLAYS